MTKKVECRGLGLEDCEFVARGETAGAVVREVVEHLRTEHDVDMPDAEVILTGEAIEDPFEAADPDAALVVERLREALKIIPPEGPKLQRPTIGRMPSGGG